MGIDLGTTNCAVGYVDLGDTDPGALTIDSFPIPQLVSSGRLASHPTLPSFLYLPARYVREQTDLALPWAPERDYAVGVYAREEGALSPEYLVSSAKSWLCHAGVDRKAPILPWGSNAVNDKVSPVEASARYLQHIREAWEHRFSLSLEEQQTVVTIPASFDQAARELTLEAARQAGLSKTLLLEEPLAAFYAWLSAHEEDWQEFISPGDTILVCDVGGGTTDFTLVRCEGEDGSPALERLAVGEHLLLGGDNIDLAIARMMEKRIGENLDHMRWQQLLHQCRKAKEHLLHTGDKEYTIRIAGRGRSLVGGMVSAKLDREELKELLERDFFPELDIRSFDPDSGPVRSARPGALPYESDPAITRHLARFLLKQGKGVMPTAILFNGGSLTPEPIRRRIVEIVSKWAGREIKRLQSASLDLAISLGAAYYGLVQKGIGLKVAGGSARSFYILVETQKKEGQGTGVCLVPRGAEEGTTLSLERSFMARANQPVNFTLYSSTMRPDDALGDIVSIDEKEFHRLPPLQTVLNFGKKRRLAEIPVAIEVFLSPVGTLEVSCKSLDSPHKWRLQFELRKSEDKEEDFVEGVRVEGVQSGKENAQTLTPEDLDAIAKGGKLLESLFSAKAHERLSRAFPLLEEIIGMGRALWSVAVLRALFDSLIELEDHRKRSAQHEIRWLNLLGYTLRPGTGDPSDPWRIKKIWPLFFKGVYYPKELSVRLQWWIFWRRVAAGLSSGQQDQLFATVAKVVLPPVSKRAKRKKTKIRVPGEELREMWLMAANLERLQPEAKVRLGEQLVSNIEKGHRFRGDQWALARIGARMPLYGPMDRIVPPLKAQEWIERLSNSGKLSPKELLEISLSLARMTGDRAIDLEGGFLKKLANSLSASGIQEEKLLPLQKVVEMDRQQQDAAFGEGLPEGIILISEEGEHEG